MQETANGKIHKLEVTDDTLTSRGGLAFFVKYLEAIGIVGLLLHKFTGIKKSIKGVSVRNLFLQVLYFFFDGTSRHLSYFDHCLVALLPLQLIEITQVPARAVEEEVQHLQKQVPHRYPFDALLDPCKFVQQQSYDSDGLQILHEKG